MDDLKNQKASRLKYGLLGFLIGFVPMAMLNLFRSEAVDVIIIQSLGTGFIFGCLCFVFGRKMLDLLLRFFGNGFG
jgi:hypothetical protein